MIKRLIPILLIIVLILVTVFKAQSNNKSSNAVEQPETLSSPTNTINESFQELTIPYLRSRSFQSRIEEMKQVDKNENFTSYTASYNSDGLKINGLLLVPNTVQKQKLPAIVFVHGYIPPTLYKTREKYIDYVNYLARNGFVVFKIDLRGHGESEGEATGAYYSSDYVIDTLNAYNALQNYEVVNPNQVGLWGHSMAGNVVLRSIAARPEIRAAVIWAGAGFSYEDLLKYRINDGSYRPPENNTERQRRRKLLFDTYGEFNKESDFWKKVAPTNYLMDIKGAQLWLYFGSVFLAPFLLGRTIRYLRSSDPKSKTVGYISLCLTVLALFFGAMFTISFINQLSDVYSQINSGF